MRKIIIILGFLLLMLIAPFACTADTITIPYPVEGTIMPRTDPLNITVQITDWDVVSSAHPHYPMVWFYIWLKDNHSYGGGVYGYSIAVFENRSYTGNGTYTVSLDSSQLPFDATDYLLYTILFSVNSSNTSDATAVNNTFPGVNFSIHWASQPWQYMLSLKSANPPCYDLTGARVMKNGFKFDANTNSSVTFYLILCDKDRKVIAIGTRSVTEKPETIEEVDITHTLYPVGFKWTAMTGKTHGSGSFGNYTFFYPRQPYYYYIGIRTDAGSFYNGKTFMITNLDGTMEGNDSSSIWTEASNWSLDSLTAKGAQLYLNLAHTYTFNGYWVYLETFPGKGETIGGLTNTPANFVGLIRAYGVSIGMPWLPLIFAFAIIALIVLALFKFASKFHLSIPNYIYGFFIFVGVVLDWIVGFLDTWMFAFFIMTVIGVIVLTYREQISEFINENKSSNKDRPASERIMLRLKGKHREEE